MVTPKFDGFLGFLEAVFETCGLFGDDRNLPKGLAAQSLPSILLSEQCFFLFSLAAAVCGKTWL